MNACVLITGGFGYLGGRIAVELAQKQDFVVRLGSRKLRPSPDWLPLAQTVVMNVLDSQSIESALAGVSTIVHLAAMNEHDCIVDPNKAILINTLGTLNVLQAAIAANVERFIYLSTAHVYGAPLTGQISEQTSTKPVHPYSITHRAAEDFILAAHTKKKIIGIVVRLSNGFGAPTHPDINRWTLLVNDLCRQAIRNHKLILRSSGLQQRDFISLEDVARGVSHLIQLPREDCSDGLFNLGGNNSLTVWEMVEKICQQCQGNLGFRPTVERPTVTKEDERTTTLDYKIEKIQKTGFTLKSRVDIEIAQTLGVCNQFFGQREVWN